jgi:hypothetical protein
MFAKGGMLRDQLRPQLDAGDAGQFVRQDRERLSTTSTMILGLALRL